MVSLKSCQLCFKSCSEGTALELYGCIMGGGLDEPHGQLIGAQAPWSPQSQRLSHREICNSNTRWFSNKNRV